MENAIETVKRGGFTAHIYYDTDTLNPRKDWDNLGKIVSRRLTSDVNFKFSGDRETDIERLNKNSAQPLSSLFICIRTAARRSIRLVSRVLGIAGRQAGFFATTEDICKEYNCKRVNPAIRHRVAQILIGEIETYDQYIRGEVYGYELFDKTGNVIDSCCGIYGCDYVKEEVSSLIDWHIRQAAEEEKAQFALFVNAGLPIPERG